jgi:hypothetical protein
MPRAFGLLQEALRAVGDAPALELLGPDAAATAGGAHATEASSSGQAGSTVVVFSLALCCHFGRGTAQDLGVAQRLYREFLRRGAADAREFDPVAAHGSWRGLCQQLHAHAEQLEDRQGAYFSRAAVLLEG